jgi:hypothetical protein
VPESPGERSSHFLVPTGTRTQISCFVQTSLIARNYLINRRVYSSDGVWLFHLLEHPTATLETTCNTLRKGDMEDEVQLQGHSIRRRCLCLDRALRRSLDNDGRPRVLRSCGMRGDRPRVEACDTQGGVEERRLGRPLRPRIS